MSCGHAILFMLPPLVILEGKNLLYITFFIKLNACLFQLEDLQKDLEEAKELANNRLQELDKLHLQHREVLKDVEKLKMDVS